MDNIDKFEPAAHDAITAQQQDAVYGLIKRERPGQQVAGGSAPRPPLGSRRHSRSDRALPRLWTRTRTSSPATQAEHPAQDGVPAPAAAVPAPAAAQQAAQPYDRDRDAQAFREDLASLPPVASLEAYEAMPVEAFGLALMRCAAPRWQGPAADKAGRERCLPARPTADSHVLLFASCCGAPAARRAPAAPEGAAAAPRVGCRLLLGGGAQPPLCWPPPGPIVLATPWPRTRRRGMGWSEGKAIGRGAKEEVTAKELVRRPARLGLGAAPAPEAGTKKYIKPGEGGTQAVQPGRSRGGVEAVQPGQPQGRGGAGACAAGPRPTQRASQPAS